MEFIILGILGFVLLFGSDICGIRNKSCMLRNFLAFFGVIYITLGSVMLILLGNTFEVSMSVRIIAGLFTALFLFLLIYSVLIEVTKNKEQDDKLITTGTYALSRHPGVIWFMFYYIAGSILFGNIDILIAGLIWSFGNIIYVIMQERFIFKKLFYSYEEYIETTPMLLPNIRSIKKCLTTIDGGQNERFTSNV